MEKYKLITCLLSQHVAIKIMTTLKTEKNIITANLTYARGTSSKSNFHMKVVEIITVLVEESQADEIFYYLYDELQIGEPHKGMIYQEAILRATKYRLPDLVEN